ncbi:MAG: DNA repair protein RecO [Oscillospiraceae bacterium]|nr:DNA repair protein RecO [Oscillospiraceae bacterium]
MFKKVKALCLREVKYKESDKVLTLLSSEEGRITVTARGAMKTNCIFASAARSPVYAEYTLNRTGDHWYIKEAETIEQFSGLSGSFEAYSLACYFCELLEEVADSDYPGPDMLRLGLNALYALSEGLFPMEQIKAVFELKLASLAGFEPEVGACCICGEENPETPALSLEGGILHCVSCPPGTGGKSEVLSPAVLSVIRRSFDADLKRIFSFRIPSEELERLSRVAENYLLAQLERGFGTLDYYHSVAKAPAHTIKK